MDKIVATNIRLPQKTLEYLKIIAAKERKSFACLVREALDETYGIDAKTKSKKTRAKDPFYRLCGIGKSGIKDGAVHHDRDIYGIDEKRCKSS